VNYPIVRVINGLRPDLNMTEVMMQTSAGDIKIKLFTEEAPETTANFLKLVDDGFYNGLHFHRVIEQFMIQGGCPNSKDPMSRSAGTGGPGYHIDCEINPNRHQAGTLSMAHAGKDTGGSQFFICHSPQPHLDGVHTVFGHTANMDVVNSIEQGDEIISVEIIPGD